MSEDNFDNRAYTRMADIATTARVGKADLVNAKEVQTFNLTGVTQVESAQGRLLFPGKVERLGFNPEKLMVGIIAGDFTDTEAEEVRVYYPHERQGQLVGKTVLTMKLDDAVSLMRRCAKELQIPESLLKPAVDGYSTGMSLVGDDFKLHERDIAMALSSQLGK